MFRLPADEDLPTLPMSALTLHNPTPSPPTTNPGMSCIIWIREISNLPSIISGACLGRIYEPTGCFLGYYQYALGRLLELAIGWDSHHEVLEVTGYFSCDHPDPDPPAYHDCGTCGCASWISLIKGRIMMPYVIIARGSS